MSQPTESEDKWKSFTIRSVQEDDLALILEHVNQIYNRDEPARRLAFETTNNPVTILSMEELNAYFGPRTMRRMDNPENRNLSLIAFDSSTGQLAGIILQFVQKTTAETSKIRQTCPDPEVPKSKCFQKFDAIMDILFLKSDAIIENILEIFNVREAAFNYVTSVDPNYRNQGLATELYRRMKIHLQQHGFSAALSVFTNQYSIRAATRNDFYEIVPDGRTCYSSCIDSSGEKLFPTADPEDYVAVLVCEC